MDAHLPLETTPKSPKPITRRRHTKAFKQHLVALCQEGKQSLASIAQAHHINANLLRRWVKLAGETEPDSQLVPVSVLPSTTGTGDIVIEAGDITVRIPNTSDPSLIATLIEHLK